MTTVSDTANARKTFRVTSGKYAGYTVTVDETDSPCEVWYEDRGPQVLRVHYRLFRIPSRRKFVVRHFANATLEDRNTAEDRIDHVARFFENCEKAGRASKHRHAEGHFYWTYCAGTILDDPMMQLEFEMMMDLGEGVAL